MAWFNYFHKHIYKTLIVLIAFLMLSSIDVHKSELDNIEREIEKNRQLIEEAGRKERTTLSDIQRIDDQLNISRREIRKHESDMKNLQNSITILKRQIDELDNNLSNISEDVKSTVLKTYMLNLMQNQYIVLLSANYKEAVLKNEILKRLNKKNRQYLEDIQSQKTMLIQRSNEYQIKINQVQKLKRLLELRRGNTEQEKQLKSVYLQNLKKEKSEYRAYLLQLERQKENLNKKISDLLTQEKARRGRTPDDKKMKSVPEATLRPYRNSLELPFRGNIISRFGSHLNQEYQITINNDGVEFETNEKVLYSPVRGTVIYADWLRGKGNVIVMSVDDNFALVFSNIEDLNVKKGDVVEKNYIIGTIMNNDNNQTVLYMSTWINGIPVDPELIIKR